MQKLNSTAGFTLIELVIIIIIIGVITAVAVLKMSSSLDTARYEHTKSELDALALAIAGNPSLYSNGARSDFGYVGDVGGLPPNLDALISNPGGYATWDGPYIEQGSGVNAFKNDGWGITYTYTDTLLRSTGSGTNIDKVFAGSSSALLSNTVQGYVVDASYSMPGTIYKDSLSLRLTYPNGTGTTTTAAILPSSKGNFTFSNIPIGNHTLTAIYFPDNDTITFSVMVEPNSVVKLDIVFPHDLW